jgi:hypothetical protein
MLTIHILSRVAFADAPSFIAAHATDFSADHSYDYSAFLRGQITAMTLIDNAKRKLVIALKPGISHSEKKAAEAEARKVPGFVHGAPTQGLMIARAEAGVRAAADRINYGEVEEADGVDKSETGSSFAGMPTSSKWEKGGNRYLASDKAVASYMGSPDGVVQAIRAYKRATK